MPAGMAPFAPGIGLIRLAATMVMVTGVILAARPLGDVRTPPTVTAPPETVLVPVPFDEESVPAPGAPHAPRRVRAAPRVVVEAAAASPGPVPTPRSEPAAAPSEAVVASVGMSPPQPLPPITTVDVARGRTVAGAVFAAVPHAGLTQQTP
jgi:hypothetical protein